MARSIHVRVLTTEGEAVADEAVAVRAPGERGYVGFLYNHAPLVTTLQPGTLTWRQPSGQTHALRITEGLLEIVHNRLTVLTESITPLDAPEAAR